MSGFRPLHVVMEGNDALQVPLPPYSSRSGVPRQPIWLGEVTPRRTREVPNHPVPNPPVPGASFAACHAADVAAELAARNPAAHRDLAHAFARDELRAHSAVAAAASVETMKLAAAKSGAACAAAVALSDQVAPPAPAVDASYQIAPRAAAVAVSFNAPGKAAAVAASNEAGSNAAATRATQKAAVAECAVSEEIALEDAAARDDEVALKALAAAREITGHFMVATPCGQFSVVVRGGVIETYRSRLASQMRLDPDCSIGEVVTAAADGRGQVFMSVLCADRTNDTEREVAALLLQPYMPTLTEWTIEQPPGAVTVWLTEERKIWNERDLCHLLSLPAGTVLSRVHARAEGCWSDFLRIVLPHCSVDIPMKAATSPSQSSKA